MEIIQYFTLFILSSIPFIEIFLTIPLGIFLFSLSPSVVAFICFAGNAVGIIGFLFIYSYFEKHVSYHTIRPQAPVKKQGAKKKHALIEKVFKKFGVFGAAILIPMILSSHLGILFYRTIGVSKLYLLHWVIAGLAFWTITLTIASVYFPTMIK
ncbi:small multi-drug export protein [Alkalicoccobacillus murimartini]|uniref:DNA-binding protein n=1 Tax=Alkalicoccobacillus murimartini TaxID=171685 RepID=A0ABT9YCM4_9BACI|nr:small multi-drug export protein [Alkalicoccobacillus murimartini]MDQ0205378.1 hypothetical protein [Alkalicoccobacillus murimartini]